MDGLYGRSEDAAKKRRVEWQGAGMQARGEIGGLYRAFWGEKGPFSAQKPAFFDTDCGSIVLMINELTAICTKYTAQKNFLVDFPL
jgi:hypothetical protein